MTFLLQDKRNVRALFFPNNQAESVSLSVPTLQPKAPVQPSYPLVEAAFGSRLFIHDSRVIIKHLQQTIIFKIFYTRHAYQPINSALATLDAQVMWQGQFLAMLIGKRHLNRVVSFRNEDIFFAKMAILRYF